MAKQDQTDEPQAAEVDDQAAAAETPAPAPVTYRVVRGINYQTDGGEKRAEPGDLVDDLPAEAAGWLLEDGAIEQA